MCPRRKIITEKLSRIFEDVHQIIESARRNDDTDSEDGNLLWEIFPCITIIQDLLLSVERLGRDR
jgi:hypothetical protein